MNRKKIEEIVRQVEEIPVQDIIRQEIPLTRRGRHWMGLCPFHPDTKLGSFLVTPDKGVWKCFGCGEGGSGIDFIKKYKDLKFLDACFYIAFQAGLVTKAEYEEYSKHEVDYKIFESSHRPVQAAEKTTESNTADADVIDIVYSAMQRACGLSEAHRNQLLDVRGVPEEHLKYYFSFPEKKQDALISMMKTVGYFILSSAGISEEEFRHMKENHDPRFHILSKKYERIREQWPYVPGFFRNSQGEIDFMTVKGIGVLCPDFRGRICGLQVRRDEVKEGESRYIWFSSSFASERKGCSGGSSPKSPGGVVYPLQPGQNAICITEGRFKAEQIAKCGNIALYVSGVSTWRSVMPQLKELVGKRDGVFLMFDADMLGNVAVHKQLQSMAAAIKKEGLATHLIVWPKEKGKGFDDLVLTEKRAYTRYLKRVEFEDFETVWKQTCDALMEEFQIKAMKELKPGQAEVFNEKLQKNVEKNLGLTVSSQPAEEAKTPVPAS